MNLAQLQTAYLQEMGITVWLDKNHPTPAATSKVQPEATPAADPTNPTPPPTAAATNSPNQHWQELAQNIQNCTDCELCHSREKVLVGDGNLNADWLLIGEEPSPNEATAGVPFIGDGGKLLADMLLAIGLDRQTVYTTNIVKCSHPSDKAHSKQIKSCNKHLSQQIALLQPKIILTLGLVATQALLQSKQPLAKIRGKQQQLGNIPLIATYHPDYLLRAPISKSAVWDDLQLANTIVKRQ